MAGSGSCAPQRLSNITGLGSSGGEKGLSVAWVLVAAPACRGPACSLPEVPFWVRGQDTNT